MSLRYFQGAFWCYSYFICSLLQQEPFMLLVAPTGAPSDTFGASKSSFRYFLGAFGSHQLVAFSIWCHNHYDRVLCFLRLYFIVFFALIHVSLIDDQVDPQINKVQFSNKNNANLVYLIFDGKCKQSHAKENEPMFQKKSYLFQFFGFNFINESTAVHFDFLVSPHFLRFLIFALYEPISQREKH